MWGELHAVDVQSRIALRASMRSFPTFIKWSIYSVKIQECIKAQQRERKKRKGTIIRGDGPSPGFTRFSLHQFTMNKISKLMSVSPLQAQSIIKCTLHDKTNLEKQTIFSLFLIFTNRFRSSQVNQSTRNIDCCKIKKK